MVYEQRPIAELLLGYYCPSLVKIVHWILIPVKMVSQNLSSHIKQFHTINNFYKFFH